VRCPRRLRRSGETANYRWRQEEAGLTRRLYAKWEADGPRGSEIDASNAGHGDFANKPSMGDETEDVGGRQHPEEENTKPSSLIHNGILFSENMVYSVRSGFGQFIYLMATYLSDYRALCNALKSLHIDVLAGPILRDIMNGMTRVRAAGILTREENWKG
jgi:hypothetical protein